VDEEADMDDRLLHRRELFIGGEWVPSSGGTEIPVVSPATEEVIGEASLGSDDDIDRAVAAAREAFDEGPWPRMTPDERADLVARAAEMIRKRDDDLAGLLVEEVGAVASHVPMQNAFVSTVFDYYADLARSFEFERTVVGPHGAGLVAQVPAGVVGAIVPWNGPVTLAAWKTAPALVAGCTVVLKPPPETPLSNYVLAEALDEAGIPPSVFNVVPGGREVGEHLVTHPGTDKIAFTGSTAAGKRIMSLCGEQVKRVSLELGGKSACVVLDDADIATSIPRVVGIGMLGSGQVCAAQTRIVVHRSRYAEAVEAAVATASAMAVGDPHDPASVVGPLIAERQRDRVEGYLALATEAGARIACGGDRPAHLPRGWYVSPTILSEVDNSMRVAREEIFGPVLGLIPYDDEDEAVRIANDTPYGLAAGVWSADDERALRVARRLRAGTVNTNTNGVPLPLVPFGGFKQSGIGRELGPEGLVGYLETQCIGLPPSSVGGG
jgi:acyl-CoA reductase-like NAD-dependent aldehyde dehydrogenase